MKNSTMKCFQYRNSKCKQEKNFSLLEALVISRMCRADHEDCQLMFNEEFKKNFLGKCSDGTVSSECSRFLLFRDEKI